MSEATLKGRQRRFGEDEEDSKHGVTSSKFVLVLECLVMFLIMNAVLLLALSKVASEGNERI